MTAEVGELLASVQYRYAHGSFEMLALAASRTSGFELRVHDAFDWVHASDLPRMKLAPADVELVQKLLEAGYWA